MDDAAHAYEVSTPPHNGQHDNSNTRIAQVEEIWFISLPSLSA